MLLRTSIQGEKEILDWFVENFGEEDARDLVTWVWDRRGADPPVYLDVLASIARSVTTEPEGRKIVQNLLEVARMPKEMSEACEELAAHMAPIMARAKIQAQGHRDSKSVLDELFEEVRLRLREKIRNMFPDKHRAFIDGALLVAIKRDKSGHTILDYRTLVRALFKEDALQTTAPNSHI